MHTSRKVQGKALQRWIKLWLHKIFQTSPSVSEHLTDDAKRSQFLYIMDVISEMSIEKNLPLPQGLCLNVRVMAYSCNTNTTSENYGMSKGTFERNLQYHIMLQQLFACTMFCPTKPKLLGVVLLEGHDDSYGFSKMRFFFHLILQ